MTQYIDKDALVAEIKKRIKETESMQPKFDQFWAGQISAFKGVLKILDTLEVKEVDVSNISENLAEAYEYLDYTSTGNLAHNKPMVSARLKKAIRSLFDAGLFELTHDKQYRMEHLGLKAQKGEKV